jgi:hypothetical protein
MLLLSNEWRPNRMPSPLAKLLLVTAVITLGGCAVHNFAPGPGMSAYDFEPQAAECRLFARSGGHAVAAFGRPAYVAGALIGSAIGQAVRQQNDYNDCMQARGWRVVDGVQAPATTLPTQVVVANQVTGSNEWSVARATCIKESHTLTDATNPAEFPNYYATCVKNAGF